MYQKLYGGLSLGNLFRALRRSTVELKFDTPDPNVVSQTNHNHPAPQCRLDTYFAGSICDKSYDDVVSQTNPNQGVCTREAELPVGQDRYVGISHHLMMTIIQITKFNFLSLKNSI